MSRIIPSILASCSLLAVPAAFASDPDESDRNITEQVLARFAEHADLGTQLTVRTIKGVVYLSGLASTGLVKSNAESLAQSIHGVKQVVDHIGVSK